VNNEWRASTSILDPIKKNIIIQLQIPLDSTILEIPAGSQMIVKIKSFTNTALVSSNTDSFKLQTFTDQTLRYAVDQISTGLVLFSCEGGYYLAANGICTSCPMQCKTCISPTVCTSCFTAVGDILKDFYLG
jgi:hypothetical protein